MTLLLWARGAGRSEDKVYILERVKGTFRLITLMLVHESVAKAILLGIAEDKKRAKKIATFMREHGQSYYILYIYIYIVSQLVSLPVFDNILK